MEVGPHFPADLALSVIMKPSLDAHRRRFEEIGIVYLLLSH